MKSKLLHDLYVFAPVGEDRRQASAKDVPADLLGDPYCLRQPGEGNIRPLQAVQFGAKQIRNGATSKAVRCKGLG